jgi:hypothetical protein
MATMAIAAATPTSIQIVRFFFESAAVADVSDRVADSARDCVATALPVFDALDATETGARGRLAATVVWHAMTAAAAAIARADLILRIVTL